MLSANQITGFFEMYYLKKEVNDKFIFGMQINIEVFYNVILWFLVYATRHAQSTQNKLAYLCNISRNGGEIDFLPANKHESLLQVDSITLGLRSHTCSKYPKAISSQYLCNIGRKT